jgi:putative membrane protein
MTARGKIQITIYVLGFAGAALFTFLLIRQGIASVGTAVATAGWGIAAVAAFHLLPNLLDTIAWWVLFPRADRPRLQSLFWMRWIGEAISNLVPSAAVGGDIVRARLAAICGGAHMATAAATVIIDVTLGIFTQVGFTLLGLVLLVAATGHTHLLRPTLIGAVIGVVAAGGFYFAQRLGMFRFIGTVIARLAKSPEWQSIVQGGEALDEGLRKLYARRSGIVACCAWTIVSLICSSGEIWIALAALGLRATFVNALILQSMAMTVRSAAFPVPGALGVQESGYLLVGTVLGIPGDAAFAISLIARVRDLAVGIPALLTWQVIEGRRLWRTRVSGPTG